MFLFREIWGVPVDAVTYDCTRTFTLGGSRGELAVEYMIEFDFKRINSSVHTGGNNRNTLTIVGLLILKDLAGLLGHVLVAVHIGEVRENGLDQQLVELIYILDVLRVVHVVLWDRIVHPSHVDEPLEERQVRNPVDPGGEVELVVEIAAHRDHPRVLAWVRQLQV